MNVTPESINDVVGACNGTAAEIERIRARVKAHGGEVYAVGPILPPDDTARISFWLPKASFIYMIDADPYRPPPPAPPKPTVQPQPPAGLAATLLHLHNVERTAHAVPPRAPLRLDDRLCAAAQLHALDCARMDRLTHQGSDGSWPWDRINKLGYQYLSNLASENAAMDPTNPVAAVQCWMGSPPHRANLLNDLMTQCGFGLAGAKPSGHTYWIAVFASPATDRMLNPQPGDPLRPREPGTVPAAQPIYLPSGLGGSASLAII